jgi:orotate phosphoribosyltransferase
VTGPATGGALLAHTLAGLLEGRRPMTHPSYSFAPFGDQEGAPVLSPFYASRMKGKRVLIVDDVRNTGTTFKRCADLVIAAGGSVIGTMQIVDRCEACVSVDAPNVSLIEYKAPPNYPAASCPMCAANVPITTF